MAVRCEVCGQRLTLAERWRNMVTRQPESYPFRSPDGVRRECPVRAICRSCRGRGERHRAAPAAAGDEGPPPRHSLAS